VSSVAFFGMVVSNEIPSPFGMVTGAPCLRSTAFEIINLRKTQMKQDLASGKLNALLAKVDGDIAQGKLLDPP